MSNTNHNNMHNNQIDHNSSMIMSNTNHNNNNQIDHNSSIIISNHNKDNTNNNPISNSGHPNAILRHRDLAFHLIFIMAHHTGHHINYN